MENGQDLDELVDNLVFSGFVYQKAPIPEISDISPQLNPKGVCLMPKGSVGSGVQVQLPGAYGESHIVLP